MSLAEERGRAVEATVARIRAIESAQGVTREALEAIKGELLALAAREELFPEADFPLPEAGAKFSSRIFRLSEDPDHRFALYANSALSGVDTPAHNHRTWAAIVGVRGEELNKFYRRTEDGAVAETGQFAVGKGTGVTFMPEDLHSIHIHGRQPVLNFHMYGLALEQLHDREYYSTRDNCWRIFPAQDNIEEARAGL